MYFVFLKKKQTMDLTQQEWASKLAEDTNAIILDVRTPEECSEGMIPNAVNIDIFKGQGFVYAVQKLDASKNFYVYCKAGGRSSQACSMMNELGIKNAYNLMGGFMNWEGEKTM